MRKLIGALAAAALLAVGCGGPTSTVLTEYGLPDGSTTYALHQKFDGSMEFTFVQGQKPPEAPEGAQPFQMDLKARLVQKARSTEKGTRLDISYHDPSGSMNAMGQTVDLSKAPDMVDQDVVFTINKQGKVVSQGRLAPQNLQSPASALPGNDFRGLYPQLPKDGAKKGDTWETREKVPFLGGKAIVARHTYVRTDSVNGDKVAVIETVIKQSLDSVATFADFAEMSGQEAPPEMKDVKMRIAGSIDTKGTVSLRLEDTLPVDSTGGGSFEMRFTFEGASEMLQGLQGMVFKGDIELTVGVKT